MARDGDATRSKLQHTALGLFDERGFDATTAADIAAAAGVTERTFFRHFADKRDVLFTPQDRFERPFIEAISAATDPRPRALIEAAILAGSQAFRERERAWSTVRWRVLEANSGLQERELSKHAELAVALATALAARGLDTTRATLAAEVAALSFRQGYARWLEHPEGTDLLDVQRETLAGLDALFSPTS